MCRSRCEWYAEMGILEPFSCDCYDQTINLVRLPIQKMKKNLYVDLYSVPEVNQVCYPCLPLFTLGYPWLPLFTLGYPWLPFPGGTTE